MRKKIPLPTPELPKIPRFPKLEKPICDCEPVCKQRRRTWKGKVQKTSDEHLLERKPKPECVARRPKEVIENGPCPLHLRTKHMNIVKRGDEPKPKVVRICQAPISNQVDTTYLQFVELAKKLGAYQAVNAKCAFCNCCQCCICSGGKYKIRDAERDMERQNDMQAFDKRVKSNYMDMKIMYDKT